MGGAPSCVRLFYSSFTMPGIASFHIWRSTAFKALSYRIFGPINCRFLWILIALILNHCLLFIVQGIFHLVISTINYLLSIVYRPGLPFFIYAIDCKFYLFSFNDIYPFFVVFHFFDVFFLYFQFDY